MALPLLAPFYAGLKSLLIGLVGWFTERLFSSIVAAGAFGVTYLGVSVFIDRFVGGVMSSLGKAPESVFNILMMCGFGESFNILISAVVFGFSFNFAQSLGAPKVTP